MPIWSAEIKGLGILYEAFKGKMPGLEKELGHVLKTEDENVIMLYSRRCLEVIITDICERELKRPRGTEPLKGIIDKLNKENKIPAHIISSMYGLNELSTYGTHPKGFDPEQVKPVLNNLSIVIKWYFKYLELHEADKYKTESPTTEYTGVPGTGSFLQKPGEKFAKLFIVIFLVIIVGGGALIIFLVSKPFSRSSYLEKSVAVLPFVNLSNDPEQEYFSEGLVEEILDRLCRIVALKVISRTSSSRYKNTDLPIKEIAAALGASVIMEGSVQKSGNDIRISVQLIDAKTDTHLWSKIFSKDYADIFSIYSEVAQAVAGEMNTVVTPEERRLIEEPPTSDLTAYDCYLRGIFHSNKLNEKDLEIAMQYFEIAKELDPEFALAYAGIAGVWICQQQMGIVKVSEAAPKSIEAIMKALELDSTQSEVHGTLAGRRVWTDWDWEGGEKAYRKAIEINPNNAGAHMAFSHLLNILGRPDEAMEQIKIALELDPLNPQIKAFYGIDLMFIHKFNDAVTAFREALELSPLHGVAISNLHDALYFAGREKEAMEALKNFFEKYNVPGLEIVEENFSSASYAQVWRKIGDYIVEMLKTAYFPSINIAGAYALAGEVDKAIYWLEKAYEEHDPNLPYILLPGYDILRDDPRFQEIAGKMNLPYK